MSYSTMDRIGWQWSALYPNNKFEIFNIYSELLDLYVKVLLDSAKHYSKGNGLCFGLLPLMCKVSKCQLGSLMSQSFAERMNLRGKLIVTENIVCLKHNTLEKLVVLKMNKTFIKHCRQKKALQIIKMCEQNRVWYNYNICDVLKISSMV